MTRRYTKSTVIKTNYNQICDRKPERMKAAKELVAAFTAAGATEVEAVEGDRDYRVSFKVGPHGCMMHLAGGSKVSGWLTHWHGSREYSDSFMTAAWLFSRNEFHKCKCTGYYGIFGEMKEKTVAGIECLVNELKAEAEENIS